jgi:hypothetical protein
MTAFAASIVTGICQFQCCDTPNASELFSACSAMQGSSEPVRAYSRHRATPKAASGTRYPIGAEPAWMPPNTRPVRMAAGQMPRQLRSAVKK